MPPCMVQENLGWAGLALTGSRCGAPVFCSRQAVGSPENQNHCCAPFCVQGPVQHENILHLFSYLLIEKTKRLERCSQFNNTWK